MEPNELTGTPPANVHEIPPRGQETLESMRRRFNDTAAVVGRRASDAARYAEERMQENPWSSVGAAFGFGVIIGALIALAAYQARR
jgi:ElaB/YqjD/DUF883 family membrane-anchored ribosome-binding protein